MLESANSAIFPQQNSLSDYSIIKSRFIFVALYWLIVSYTGASCILINDNYVNWLILLFSVN